MRYTFLFAVASLLASPALAQVVVVPRPGAPPAPKAGAEAPCPAQSLFPTASTDGSSIGITAKCAQECMRMSNACVCGSSNPFGDRACICLQPKFVEDYAGCVKDDCGAVGAAEIRKLEAYKTAFCAGRVTPPAAPPATRPASSVVAAPTSVASAVVSSASAAVSSAVSSAFSQASSVASVAASSAAAVAPSVRASATAALPAATAAAVIPSDAGQNKAALGLAAALAVAAAAAV
ncbi:hypothetical protein HDU86_005729 [Geranomyces michiganensis]|nr:hypothetical protein HDU86_005729 [Geranomyces michiganensis]